MIYERLHVTFVGVVATVVDSVVVAEFAGYWLHRLLHSDMFPALSRGPSDPSLLDLWPPATHACGGLPRRYRQPLLRWQRGD